MEPLHFTSRFGISNLSPGDEVFCSTFTFCASANPIVYEKACPVFIDSDPRTWTIDANLLADTLAERARSNRIPKAIVVVDIYGQSVDMQSVMEIAARYDIPVIDDAAEALGSSYQSRRVGADADMSAVSFNGNKIITTGGGRSTVLQRWSVDRTSTLPGHPGT